MRNHMNGEFSIGLSNTISSLLKDDEDYQIVLASELLNYLSNKGFYPPEDINKIMFEILKSKKSNDPAVVYNIIKVLDGLKNQGHYIESDNWDLLISSFTSLNVHLTNDSLNVTKSEFQQKSISPSSSVTSITNTSSSRGNGLVENREAKLPFLSSKALISYYISVYESMSSLNLLPIEHPLFQLFQTGNRVSTLLEEMMLIVRFCDFDTLKEIIKFFILIYRLGGASWEENLLPVICQKFRLINISKRKVLFCQLLPNGMVKNKILKGLLEDAHPIGSGSEYIGNFPSKRNRANEKELIEQLSPWLNKIRTKALRRAINKDKNGENEDDQDQYDNMDCNNIDSDNDDDDDSSDENSSGSTIPIFLNGFDIQGPIDKIELFVVMVCQLYQSAIVTSTQKFIIVQNKYQSDLKKSNDTNTDNSEKILPPIDPVSWSTVYTDFKELSKAILFSVEGVCKNQNLIQSNLNGLDIILKSKTLINNK